MTTLNLNDEVGEYVLTGRHEKCLTDLRLPLFTYVTFINALDTSIFYNTQHNTNEYKNLTNMK